MRYVFDPDRLHEIGARHAGRAGAVATAGLASDLAAAYPGLIETRPDWFFNVAGGITGIMTVLYASLREYVAVFGSPVGSEGFSGRFRMDVFDVVLAGEVWNYTERAPFEREKYRPGDMTVLRRREVKGVRIADQTWLLEYGRGAIVTSLPFALMSAHDPVTVARTLAVYTRLTLRGLARRRT
jgi:C-8 sterol isomerase